MGKIYTEKTPEELKQSIMKAVDSLRDDASVLDSVESGAYENIAKLKSYKDTPHSPLHIELLLSEASTLLEQCYGYRREAQNLEAMALQFALEQLYQQKLEEISTNEYENQDFWLYRKKLATERKLSAETYANGLSTAADLAEDTAFSAELKARASLENSSVIAFKKEEEFEEEKQKFEKNRRDELMRYLERKRLHHEKPGSALNYKERATKVRDLYQDTLKDTFSRLLALEEGLRILWGGRGSKEGFMSPKRKPHKLPHVKEESEIGYLDKLSSWTRWVYDMLEEEMKYDIPVSYTTSLRSPLVVGGENAITVFGGKSWEEAREKATSIPFVIKSQFFNAHNIENPRLRSISVQISRANDPALNPSEEIITGSVVIKPPKQKDSKEKILPILGCHIGNVPTTRESNKIRYGEYLANINPLGEWEIQLNYLSHNGSLKDLSDVHITFHCIVKSKTLTYEEA